MEQQTIPENNKCLLLLCLCVQICGPGDQLSKLENRQHLKAESRPTPPSPAIASSPLPSK